MNFINRIDWSFNKKSYSNSEIIALHKASLPKDPLMKLSKKAQSQFYDIAKVIGFFYFGSYEKKLVAVACFIKFSLIPKFYGKTIFSILIYIFIDKYLFGKSLGTHIINDFLKNNHFILLLTKEETYKKFYSKFKNLSFAFLGRRLVCLMK